MVERTIYTSFSDSDIVSLSPAMKIGLVATVNEEGLPHLTLLSSLQANTPTQLTFGQFTEGLSKRYIRENPKIGFLVMTLDKEVWRGKATFTHTANTGPEFERYNNVPMFRYNSYFGIHTVYFMDLVEHYGMAPLPMGAIVLGSIQTMAAKALARKSAQPDALNLWTRQLMDKIGNLKFLGYVGEDGYPVIIPVLQAASLDSAHIVLSTTAYRRELEAIPAGTTVALFGMTLDMEDVLMRGAFMGVRRVGGQKCATVAVDWVYNPMPPVSGQIYPEVALKPVRDFPVR
jgi:hypothetical protein